MMQEKNNQDAKLWTYYQLDNNEVYDITHQRHEQVISAVKKWIPKKNAKILEIGFGDGYLLSKLQDKYEAHGADISSEIIANISKKLTRVQLREIAVDGTLPYEDNFFDGFIASEVFEHMTDKELEKAVQEVSRVLKIGGVAVLTFPAEEKLKENECFCPNCGEVFHRWGHKQVWTVKNIQERFEIFNQIFIKDFFVRYEGVSLFESLAGWIMFVVRTMVNKFHKLSGRSYMVILKK